MNPRFRMSISPLRATDPSGPVAPPRKPEILTSWKLFSHRLISQTGKDIIRAGSRHPLFAGLHRRVETPTFRRLTLTQGPDTHFSQAYTRRVQTPTFRRLTLAGSRHPLFAGLHSRSSNAQGPDTHFSQDYTRTRRVQTPTFRRLTPQGPDAGSRHPLFAGSRHPLFAGLHPRLKRNTKIQFASGQQRPLDSWEGIGTLDHWWHCDQISPPGLRAGIKRVSHACICPSRDCVPR
jgi:hypothetical protein